MRSALLDAWRLPAHVIQHQKRIVVWYGFIDIPCWYALQRTTTGFAQLVESSQRLLIVPTPQRTSQTMDYLQRKA